LLVVLLAALAVVAYLVVDTFTGGFALPNVVGKQLPQAEQILVAKGLVIGTTTNAANPAPTGTVLSTNPASGTNVSKKAVVNLVVSAGETEVQVQQVVGDQLDIAEQVLKGQGLNFTVMFIDSGGQQGIVLGQTPAPGTKVRKGFKVVLSLPKPTNQVDVPSLVNLTPQQAAVSLTGVGLTVGSQDQACSNSTAAGQVSGSNPSGGTQVGRNSSVNLTVSSGNCSIVVRDVTGQSSSDATGVLQGQGLTVAVGPPTSSCNPSQNGNVISQSPAAGTQVTLPATDTITVCNAPSSTTTTTNPF
jgi:serine/threonine-protein kinase